MKFNHTFIGRKLIGENILLLETVGRKSNKLRKTPLTYVVIDEGYLVAASYGGRDKTPDWFFNINTDKVKILVNKEYKDAKPLIVDEIEGKLVVSLNDGNFPEIKISPVYQEMFFTKNNNEKKLDKFLKDKIESANWLIQAIQKREITIMKVMNEIIKIQSDFFEGKIRSIKPLILKDIADKINMDISTVSRVTNGKYVQTPWGVYELKHFFSDKLINNYGEKVSTKNIKLLIEDIIKKEDKNNPLSDEIISKLVYEKGFTIARRTISKYREQLNIPIARLRRMLVN